MANQYSRARYCEVRTAHSLVELMAATVCGSILMGGLVSTMFIGLEIANSPSASNHRLTASQIATELADELRWATVIHNIDDGAIEFLIPDSDGNSIAERIIYRWGPEKGQGDEGNRAPLPGDPLWKSFNNDPKKHNIAPEHRIADHVEIFQLNYDDDGQPLDNIRLSISTHGKRFDPNATLPPIVTDIRLLNKPEILGAHWRLDFEAGESPLTLDTNCDGNDDWVGSFATGDLTAQGTWKPSGLLQSRPHNKFAGSATIETRFCNDAPLGISEDRINIGMQFPAYRQNKKFSLITVGLLAAPDGSRTLMLRSQPDSNTSLIEIPNLANDFVRVKITTTPGDDSLRLQVNGVEVGDVFYSALPTTTVDRSVQVGKWQGGSGQFDYLDIRVRPTL